MIKDYNIIVPLAAITMIFVLEGIALFKGINGTTLGLAFSGIGAVAGYCLKTLRSK